MNRLPHLALGSTDFLEIDIPLSAHTGSHDGVARLVGTLLNDVSRIGRDLTHDDILQALVVTMAVRQAMANAEVDAGGDLSMQLLDAEVCRAGEPSPCVA